MTVTESEPVVPRALVARVKAILLKPAQEWDVIDAEPATVQSLYKSYLIYIAAISPLARLIGDVVFIHAPIIGALVQAIVSYAVWLVGAYLMGLLIDVLAPTFGGQRNPIQALKVAVYSSTASAVAGIFAIIPALSMLAIVGLYGLYLLWLGLPKLMKVPQDKQLAYFAAIIVVLLLAILVIGLLLAPILLAPISLVAHSA